MAIKYGRPIEARLTPVEAKASRLDLSVRPRRNRKADWTRRLVARERADRRRPDLAVVPGRWIKDARGGRRRCPASSGSRSTRRCARPSARPELRIPCLALFPYTDPKLRDDDGTEALQSRTISFAAPSGPSRRPCRTSACSATSRSIPTPVMAMTGCCATASSSTTKPSRADAPGAGRGGGRRRYHRAVRHDGRPRGRDPLGARCGQPHRRFDHGLCGQICVRLLRPVPRRRRLLEDADRRQAHLPDGSRQHRRGAARGRARYRRRRRHGDGEARHAISRRAAAREARPSACRRSPIRCRANTR